MSPPAVRDGPLHPASVAVLAALAPEVAALYYRAGHALDASAELDDVVQMLALAQLEAEAAATDPAARGREAQRRARRALWRVQRARGRTHRAPWDPARVEQLVGPDGGLATVEELVWDEIVETLGWRDALALWLWAVEDWSLSEVGEWQGLAKQGVWRRLRRALGRLRWRLAS